jgi:hypothetical protein
MRKVLAITVALMIAAIVLTPALGYTNQSAGNQSYSATSGSRVNYSVASGVPAHNLTQDMVANKYSIKAPAVQSTRVAYSFKEGSAQPYSMKLVGVTASVTEGYQTTKAAARLGSAVKGEETAAPAAVATPVEAVAATNETAPAASNATAPVVEAAPVEQPKFVVEGIAFDDADGDGVLGANETGLANLTINLEQPAGTVINSAVTPLDGKFSFTDLAAGEYTVSEAVEAGWKLIAPVDGKIAVTITNESITNLAFANELIPVVAENVTVAATNETATVPVNETATVPLNATAPA